MKTRLSNLRSLIALCLFAVASAAQATTLSITTQPQSQTVPDGYLYVTFNVAAMGGTGAYTYQWKYQASGSASASPIAGATGASYTVNNNNSPAAIANAGSYTVTVTDSSTPTPASVTSNAAVLTVTPASPGNVSVFPTYGHAIPAGTNLYLYASSGGTPPFTYQWYHNGAAISGATNPYYFVRTAGNADNGAYSVELGNSLGNASSLPFALEVTPNGGWQRLNPFPSGNIFSRVYFDGTKFIATGLRGGFYTSTDGSTWTIGALSTANNLYGFASGNGVSVILGGVDSIYTSTDGATWTPRNSIASVDGINYGSGLQGLDFGNGVFVAAGENGQTATSSDGVTWTIGTVGTGDSLSGPHYFNGFFYVLGGAANGATKLYVTTLGQSWSAQTLSNSITFNDIACDGTGHFVVVGNGGVILTSSNGTTWSSPTSIITGTDLTGISYVNNLFIATCTNGKILTSSDQGATWATAATTASGGLYGAEAVYGNGAYVMPGGSAGFPSGPSLWSSTDASTWANRNTVNLRIDARSIIWTLG